MAPPDAGAVLAHVVPLLVSTFPELPGAINCTAEVPLPRRTELAVSVAKPVPPKPAARVPATETAPDVAVAGVRPVDPNDIVETPPDAAFCQVAVPPLTVRTWPVVPMERFAAVLEPLPTTMLPSAEVVTPVPP